MKAMGELVKGIYKENPVFRLALGLCPALAVSTSSSSSSRASSRSSSS